MLTPRNHGPGRRSWIALALSMSVIASSAAGTRPARAEGASIDEATDEQKDAAKKKYITGMKAFQAEHYDEALGAFRQSYDTVASPNSHLLVARTLARLGRNVEAYKEYTAVIDEANEAAQTQDKYEKTALAARNERAEVTGKIGFVQASVDAVLTVGDEPLDSNAWGKPIPVAPGSVDITLQLANGDERTVSVDVATGKTETVTVEPPRQAAASARPAPAPEARPNGIPHRTLAWVSGGIGVAGFATFAAFGVLNNKKFDDLKDQCPGGVCPPNLTHEADRGRRYQAVANAGLGVGIAGIGAGLVLWLIAPSQSSKERVQARKTQIAIGPRSVTVKGRF